MTIADNIAARQWAEAFVRDVGEQPPRFWEELARLAKEQLPAEPAPVDPYGPMSDDEAKRFSSTLFPRGKYLAERVCDVTPSYCLWWAEEDSFSIAMRRYTKSGFFQRLQAEAVDDEWEDGE